MTQATQTLPYSDDSGFFDVRARDWTSIFGLGLVAVALGSLSPSLPVVSLAVLGIVVVSSSAPLAFALGQLALIPVVSEISPAVGVAQLGLVAVLTEPARSSRDMSTLTLTVLGWSALVGLILGTSEQGLLTTGGLLCLAVGVGIYLTYRVTLVRLELVSTDELENGSDLKTKG